MFRIKTDIKHFKCDNRDKVERLIRNWVIRPSDLIYDDDDDHWRPIGQHPTFAEIFATLDGSYEPQPETVITERAAETAAADREKVNGSVDGDSPAQPAAESTPPKSAVLRPRRGTENTDDEQTNGQPRAAVLRPGTKPESRDLDNPEPEPDSRDRKSEPDARARKSEPDSRELDSREPESGSRDRKSEPDSREPEPDSPEPEPQAGQPAPPEPGPDVVGVIRDSDEITLMTDRTLNMLMVDRPSSPDGAAPDEPTQRTERPDFDDDNTAAPDEPTQRTERPDFDDEDEAGAPDPMAPTPEQPDERTRDDEPEKLTGRHGLPEEVFTTAELGDASVEEEAEPIDELGALDRESDSVMGSGQETRSNWNIVLDEMPPPDEEGDVTAEDDPVDRFQDTDEIDFVDRDDVPLAVDDESDGARMKDEEEADYDLVEITEDGEDDEDVDQKAGGEVEFESADKVLDDAFEDLEESAIAARRAEEEADDAELAEIDDVEALPDVDAVSEGYHVEFSIPIEPSGRSLGLGIQRSRISERKRDLYFSRPEPKKSGELVTQNYDLDEPSGASSSLPFALSEGDRLPGILLAGAAVMLLLVFLVVFVAVLAIVF